MTTPERTASPQASIVDAPDSPPADVGKPLASDYDRRYYQSGLGPPYEESEPHWTHFFGQVADEIVRQLSPRTALDAGCATGFLVAALAERGVEASGVDISDYAVKAAVSGAKGRIRVQSLTDPLDGWWDLVVCIEVLEHMPSLDIQAAIDNICNCTDRVLFSSTPHDFSEPSHINVKPVATWISWFAQRGFFRRSDIDTSFLSPWAGVLERRARSVVELAFDYETELAPLREEILAKRSALLDANREIGDLRDRLLSGRGIVYDTDEQFQSPERVLSLIDEVIGLQTELAELRYQHDRELATLHAAEAQFDLSLNELNRRAEAAEARVSGLLSSRSWQLGQQLAKPLHLFRSRIRRRR